MASVDLAAVFGRHEFFIRRLHSLTGLIPIGGFLAFHLATNASILDGPAAFEHRVRQIHSLGPTTLFLLEWPLIFLPILFHGLIGLAVVSRGKRNLRHYPFAENARYTLQRATGVIALIFIVLHVFHMHGWLRFDAFHRWAQSVGGAQFNPENVATAAAAIQSSWLVVVFYAIGVSACVYHLANGLWTMGITWGAWTGPAAQRRATAACLGVGLILAVIGLGALWGMATLDVSTATGFK